MALPHGPDPAILTRGVLRLSWLVEAELRAHDLTVGQYRLLAQLSSGSAYASTVASQLSIRRPSFSAAADALVARGLVERQGDEADRRRVSYSLTDTGRALLVEAEAGVARRLGSAGESLGEKATGARAALALWYEALGLASARARRARAQRTG